MRRSFVSIPRFISAFALLGLPLSASTLKISASSTVRSPGEVEGDYKSAHVYVDEVAGDTVPFTVFFDPQTLGVQTCEVYTNLNRRDRADDDADGDGIEDGIKPPANVPPGSDAHYFKAYTMTGVSGGYQLTLNASRTGAYRLTVRWRLTSDSPGTYRYYNNDDGGGKRDYAIVVSPKKARNIIMYEVNPVTIIATGTGSSQRGRFADLANGITGGAGTPRFSLDYVKGLGANMLWFQPIHPNGIAGRQIDSATGQPFEVGSPYAVKWNRRPPDRFRHGAAVRGRISLRGEELFRCHAVDGEVVHTRRHARKQRHSGGPNAGEDGVSELQRGSR